MLYILIKTVYIYIYLTADFPLLFSFFTLLYSASSSSVVCSGAVNVQAEEENHAAFQAKSTSVRAQNDNRVRVRKETELKAAAEQVFSTHLAPLPRVKRKHSLKMTAAFMSRYFPFGDAQANFWRTATGPSNGLYKWLKYLIRSLLGVGSRNKP